MAAIEIIDPGVMTTVQDLGRFGYRSLGVAPSGACDQLSLRIANRLVGNPDAAAALEITAIAPVAVRCCDDMTLALTGASMGMSVELLGESAAPPLPCRPLHVVRGSVLRLFPALSGLRSYLAVAGGIQITPTLGSCSTHIPSSLGGRALVSGDALLIGQPSALPSLCAWEESAGYPLVSWLAQRTIRVTRGPHADLFGESRLNSFLGQGYAVASQSDRMGLRLHAEVLHTGNRDDMPTEGMPVGAVQIPPNGQPIVLLHDGPPTGGYPVIAVVITADLPAIAQRRAGDRVRFQLIDVKEAKRLHVNQMCLLSRLLPYRAATEHAPEHRCIDLNCDLGEDAAALQEGREAQIIALVSSINIACGGHAGDEHTIRSVLRIAADYGVAVGAHPSFPDRSHFGRRHMTMSRNMLRDAVEQQLSLLARLCDSMGIRLRHVKPHGALYHAAERDADVAMAIAEATGVLGYPVALIGRAGGEAIKVWQQLGIPCLREGFADRLYDEGGQLVPRDNANAVIIDPGAAAAQACALACRQPIRCADGSAQSVTCDTICVHSDSPDALTTLQAIRLSFAQAGITVSRV